MEKNVYTVQIDPELLASSTGSKKKSVLPKKQVDDEDFFDFSKRRKSKPSAERGYNKELTGEHKTIKKKLAKIDDYSEFDFKFGAKNKAKTQVERKDLAETAAKPNAVKTEQPNFAKAEQNGKNIEPKTRIGPIKKVSISDAEYKKVVLNKNSLRRRVVAQLSKSGRPLKKVSLTRIVEVTTISPKLKQIKFLPVELVQVNSGTSNSEVINEFKERLLSLKKFRNELHSCSVKVEPKKAEPTRYFDSEVEKIIMIARLGSLFDCDASAIS